ncbi:MAG TPA: hypothetical protein VER03_25415 [Bryobacteraceae bacterium]|nr:hypothetical protein [Bryobacteraceae bacterium]
MRNGLSLAAVLVSAALVVFVVRLAMAQSASGTAYPPYSSMRADSQGLKALHDVVEVVGRDAVRGFLPAHELGLKNTTIVRLGMSVGMLGSPHARKLAESGNTVVLGVANGCESAEVKEWQLKFACGDEGPYVSGSGWMPVAFNAEEQAWVVERRFGSGEIVVVANSRLLNNGALARQPQAAAIAALVERRPTVMFDEHSLGVADASSVGTLLRHYRLHGVMLAALMLFGMFVWKNSSSFLPRAEVAVDEIAGRDTTSGLANLMRSSVPRSELLSVAIGEWAKPLRARDAERELRTIAAGHADPVEAYNAVARAVHRKRTLA